MTATSRIAATAAALALLLASCGRGTVVAPAIPFASRTDTSIKDPDNPSKIFRVDFAEVERRYPLTRDHLAAITPENVTALSQEEVDQVYGRLTAGPVPQGVYRSAMFFSRGDSLRDRIEEIAGGLKGRLAADAGNTLELAVGVVWKGKVFDRQQRIAHTLVEDLAPLERFVDNPNSLPTTSIPREGPLSLIMSRTKVWLLFPAKVFCGQSLLDGRREFVVIDYSYADDIAGYRARPDDLLGRDGLQLREEIRMVRPGFYLGRAYVGRILLLNFTLYDDAQAASELASFTASEPIAEDCWVGEQVRNAAPE